jgi:recombination protein RecT
MTKSLAKQDDQQLEKRTWKTWLDSHASDFEEVATAHLQPERLTRVFLSELKRTPKLKDCSPDSLMMSLVLCSQLGLEPSSPVGHIYLIPYGKTCTPIIGYKGMMELIRRVGTVKQIEARVFSQADLDEGRVRLSIYPAVAEDTRWATDTPWRDIVGGYCVVEMDDGKRFLETCTKAEIEDRKRRSGAGNSGPWKTDPVAMAEKCAVRKLFGRGRIPISAEHRAMISEALANDGDSGYQGATHQTRSQAAMDGMLSQVQGESIPATVEVDCEVVSTGSAKDETPATSGNGKPIPCKVTDLPYLESLIELYKIKPAEVWMIGEDELGFAPDPDVWTAEEMTEAWAVVCERHQ